jgi:AcrR family transcriptional regulator
MPAVAPQGDDRRIRRTRLALREAMIALLPKRGWDDLSVQEICERADVGRSTFYMHYRGKEQLLTDGLEDLRLYLSGQGAPPPVDATGPFPFIRGLLEHVHEQRALFRSLIGRGSGYVVQLRFRKMVARLVVEELSGRMAAGWRREALTAYVAGALVELLSWWVDARTAQSLEAVEALFQELTGPVLAQALRRPEPD